MTATGRRTPRLVMDATDPFATRLATAARALQDAIRGNLVPPDRAEQIAGDLDRITAELQQAGAEDALGELTLHSGWKGTGQTMTPPYEVTRSGTGEMHGSVVFSRFHLGAGGAVHGGALSLWVDDVLGRLALGVSENLTRTAYLHIEFRKLVPVGHAATFSARVESKDGRKRKLRASLSINEEVAVEAHGLWIETRPPTG